MRIKIDKNLAIVANRAGKDANEMSKIIVDALLDAGFIEDEDDCYGLLMAYVVLGINETNGMLAKIGINQIDLSVFSAFSQCVIIGDGDCPECGGEMELEECSGREVPSVYGDVPPDYETDYEKRCCSICGYTIEKDYCQEKEYEPDIN